MIKNIYDKRNNYYKHEYYCDNCFSQIQHGEILRNKKARENNIFDLCFECKRKWDNK